MAAMFSLFSLYFLINKKIKLSAMSLVFGVFSKLYPAMFLLPITFFFIRSNSTDKLKNLAKFYLIFIIGLMLLILPYLGDVVNFFNTLFVPNPVVIANFASDPVTNPLAFGLTYWSVFLINRVVNIPLSGAFIFLVSGVLVIFSVALTFKKINKMTFRRPEFDLITSMLLFVLALFLSLRIVLEQWFVWALPFLVILCVGGKVKGRLFWGASILALLYACLNCPLPFFFLPLAPWIGNSLVSTANFLLSFEPLRISLLAIIGCLFSLLLLLILYDFNKSIENNETSSSQL